jgi:inorganic pyrophosphatase
VGRELRAVPKATDMATTAYWECLRALVAGNRLVIDRKRGTAHPRFPLMIYPVDYGYIEGTSSMDGGGIDIFVGTDSADTVQGILCVIDMLKKDSEIKVLYRCRESEIEEIIRFMNDSDYMKATLVRAP